MNIISSSLHFILKSIGCDKIVFLQYFVKFGFLSHGIFLRYKINIKVYHITRNNNLIS
jgi:hypothetical protein